MDKWLWAEVLDSQSTSWKSIYQWLDEWHLRCMWTVWGARHTTRKRRKKKGQVETQEQRSTMDPGPWMEEGAQCLNRTLCLGQMCIMEYLVGVYRQAKACSFGSALALGSGLSWTPGVVPSSSQPQKHSGGWGRRRLGQLFFSHTQPAEQDEKGLPIYIKGLQVAGYSLSCPIRKDIACQRSEIVDMLSSCPIVMILWG